MGAKKPVTASCRRMGLTSAAGPARLFIRRCGLEDNPAEILSTIYGGGVPDFTKRKAVADADVWEFDQQPLIDAVKSDGMAVAGDYVSFRPSQSANGRISIWRRQVTFMCQQLSAETANRPVGSTSRCTAVLRKSEIVCAEVRL